MASPEFSRCDFANRDVGRADTNNRILFPTDSNFRVLDIPPVVLAPLPQAAEASRPSVPAPAPLPGNRAFAGSRVCG
jgi:hypothetical protein